MARCSTGYPENLLQQQGSYLGYGMYNKAVTPYGNLNSGYFSDKAACTSSLEGTQFGRFIDGSWASQPCGPGLRELTINEVWASSCDGATRAQPNDKDAFCANVFDSSGTRRNPISCGGTDPIPFQYSSQFEGLTEAQQQAAILAEELQAETDKIVAEKRKKAVLIAFIIFAFIIVAYVLWTL